MAEGTTGTDREHGLHAGVPQLVGATHATPARPGCPLPVARLPRGRETAKHCANLYFIRTGHPRGEHMHHRPFCTSPALWGRAPQAQTANMVYTPTIRKRRGRRMRRPYTRCGRPEAGPKPQSAFTSPLRQACCRTPARMLTWRPFRVAGLLRPRILMKEWLWRRCLPDRRNSLTSNTA